MRIGFAFTGAGHLLNESVQVAEKLAKDHELTIFLSLVNKLLALGFAILSPFH